MAARSTNQGANVSASRQRVRSILIASLVHAMSATGASQLAAARWTGVTVATVRRWLKGTTPVNVEAVLASARLAAPFRESLCTFDHSQSSAPYVLRAPKRKTKRGKR